MPSPKREAGIKTDTGEVIFRTVERQIRYLEILKEVEEDPDRPKFKNGNYKPAEPIAQRLLAERTGVTLATIKAQARRGRRRSEELARNASPLPPIYMLGMQTDPDHMELLGEAMRRLDLAQKATRSALRYIDSCHDQHYPIQEEKLVMAHELATSLEAALTEIRPYSLCPYCKAVPKHSSQCGECGTTGIASIEEFRSAPPKLRDAEAMLVLTHGKYESVSDNAETEEIDELDQLWADDD